MPPLPLTCGSAQVSSRAAAVLLGLFADDGGVVRVLLTRRSARLSSHRGEVCLPGGKRDEGDDGDAATALREAQEEVGSRTYGKA